MVDFVLGRLKFVYKGNWSTSTAFIKDDIVTYGGRSYVCVANHTSNASASGGFYTDSANWNLINDGVANRGVWSISTYYKINDIAKYGGKIYIATSGHTSNATANGGFYSDSSNWQLLNDGTENRGTWAISSYYKIGDVVKYGARTYIAITGHTSNANGGFYSDSSNWQLLNDGTENRGTWAISSYYKISDIVKYGGKTYIATSGHTSNATANGGFYSDSSNWQLLNDGVENKSSWSTSTYYKISDIVKYGGKTYIATSGHTSNATANGGFYSDSSNWQLLNDGVENKSSWSISTYYKIGDVVKYGARTYIAITGHTSSATAAGGFYTNIANWSLLNDGIENKGTWASGTYYKINDIVKWGADLYICNTGHTAGTNWVDTEANFTLFVGGLEFENTWVNSTLYQPGDVVRYGGYQFVATNESTNAIPTNTSFWSVFSTGFSVQGAYSNSTPYKPGDVVQFGGYVYSARVDTTGILPSNTTNWDLVSFGVKWNDNWSNTTTYYKGDTVRYGGSSYISIAHANANNEPNPGNTSNWNLLSQGANATINLTNTGDILFLNTGGLDGVAIGSNGYVLTTNTSGLPQWQSGASNNVYYVSTDGVDASDAGRSLIRPFRTIKYATQNVPNNSVIMVKAGSYQEILPITVQSGVSVIGDSQRGVTVTPAGGYSGAGNTMWLLSNGSLLKQMTFTGMTGFIPGGTADDITTATVGGVFIRLNPASPITTKSPYVVECSAISTGGTGVIVDGSVHASGNRSMLFHAYTVISDGGIGYWVSNNARAETVSCFTYFCYFGFAATGGGFIRGLNNNNSYGNYGAVSRGFDATETVVTANLSGEQLQLTANSAMTYTVGETITGANSGATGTINNIQAAANKLYYSRTNANTFANSESIVGATSGITGIITGSGVTGQKGFVVVANNFTVNPTLFSGRSIEFSGDSSAYVVQTVSGTYTNTQSKMIFVLAQEKTTASSNSANVVFRQNYSQIRLTGHDFLDIGTGNTVTTNYPNAPVTMPSQTNEVVEGRPGRVYYVSTDQNGNFRVGDYFRIEQATGKATLDASAFNLSGLSELRLGSIGAQLGESINEFSSDGTLGGNSNFAVPTEQATKTYVETYVETYVGSRTPQVFTLDDISLLFNGAQTVFSLTYSNTTVTSANVSPVDPNKIQIYIGSVLVDYNPNVYRYDYVNLTDFQATNTFINGTFNYGWYLSGASNNIINFATPPLPGMSFDGFWRSAVGIDRDVTYSANSSTYFTPLNIALGS